MSYEVRPGTRIHVKPDVLGQELDRIEQEMGALTAESVLEAARPTDSPLHAEFVWDGDSAVEQLGLIRARQLIRAVVIIPEQNQMPVRAWVHVPSETGKGGGEYDRLTTIVHVEDRYERAFSELNAKFEAAATALRELKQAAGQSTNRERLRQFALVEESFTTVREAIALLRQ
jgi:hypothetical protein